jgi:hypothetical protein
MIKLWLTSAALIAFTFGILSANQLLDSLEITENTEREFMVNQVSQSLKPQTKNTIALQNVIYEQRIETLKNRIADVEKKSAAVKQYSDPIEQELALYRDTFAQKARASEDERLQLYVDLVSKYRDYHRATTSLESFIPLKDSDSLLSVPSVQLDVVYDAGGALAQTHNRFIEEGRDSSFAAHYEPQLRRFLAPYELNVALVECHSTLCAVHLGHVWEDPYFQGFEEVWDVLRQQNWMNLNRIGDAHQYRGKGHQVQVWYLEGAL